MENEMYCKPMFKCGVCGEVFDTVAARAKCEADCIKRQEEDIKRAAEETKRLEQNRRKAEVENAMKDAEKTVNHAYKLYYEYVKDYCMVKPAKNNDNKIKCNDDSDVIVKLLCDLFM